MIVDLADAAVRLRPPAVVAGTFAEPRVELLPARGGLALVSLDPEQAQALGRLLRTRAQEARRVLFGDALRDLRQEAGLSLAGLAARLPYSKEMIAKVETGERRPTMQFAQVCDAALGTAPLLVILAEEAAA